MKKEMIKDNVANLLLAVCVGMSCMYMVLAAETITITTVIAGVLTGGAVFCIGYLGKLYILGGEERRKKGRKLFWKLFCGFLICFVTAVILV